MSHFSAFTSLALLGLVSNSVAFSASLGPAELIPGKIILPPGFQISLFAKGIPNARAIARSPKGTLFVGNMEGDKVFAVTQSGSDYKTAKVFEIAHGLKMPNGVVFHAGNLYVATLTRLLRFDHIEEHLDAPPQPITVHDSWPDNDWHGWKFLRLGPDGHLYFPIGMPCNVCLKPHSLYGAIYRMSLDGKKMDPYAKGIRSVVGLDWDPATRELWFTDNGQDGLGDQIPPDELNHASKAGMNFGFPYCRGTSTPNLEFGEKNRCSEFTPPALELPAHVAPLGMRFYTGKMFPEKYRNQIFVAEHGSWNRSSPIGARISVAHLKKGKPTEYEIFAQGWLQGKEYLGRPVDLEVLPDGSLLVTDDLAGVIYRITYQTPSGSTTGL